MSSINTAALINFLGFTTGAALYAMLLVMVLRRPAEVSGAAAGSAFVNPSISGWRANKLLFATAVLGLLWNAGALASYGVKDFGVGEPAPLLVALSFAALGFLPAVVVHSALQSRDAVITSNASARLITLAAYVLSAAAGVMHFYATVVMAHAGHSDVALRTLTIGYLVLIVALFFSTRRQPGWKRAVWASALAVFAVSALHLSQHHYGGAEIWPIELLGHHASLPLALAILYQDYRFAFADIFLKRALALLMLVGLAFGLYVSAAAPLLAVRDRNQQIDPRAVGALVGLWVVTALLYPTLRRAAVWLVDTVVLRRADYAAMRARLTRDISLCDEPDEVLDEICRALGPALTAREVVWLNTRTTAEDGAPANSFPSSELVRRAAKLGARISHASHGEETAVVLDRIPGASAVVFVPTTEPPSYHFVVGELAGGRRLLSDDTAMLESVAVIAARRIDALRVAHERYEQGLREQEIGKLATEAQLRALRAQINPHFLFNALTTIGYLIKAAPERALDTLMKLTDLLRRVLRSTGEFATLGEELKLITSYLDIERERFEERLRVRIEVPPELLSVRLPSLLVQPLVENSIKHGITPSRYGGQVTISARVEAADDGLIGARGGGGEMLCISVEDTGVGAGETDLARGRRRGGFGLSNVEERLRCYYSGQAASLTIKSAPGVGTAAEIRIPIAAASGTARAEILATKSTAAGEGRGA